MPAPAPAPEPTPAPEECPVSNDGDAIVLDTRRMQVGQQYPTMWRGRPAYAVKQANGIVNFVSVPTVSP